ncbi:nitric oxide-sensing protein NosP [Pokkaliibacter sp. CJK22405]|uniref:nitric oxide-sensing protein NosP n=1 Tax=Pokkaliibacter sp. CJK22405 TaxID=3384615 RepID=UPI003984D32F
MPLSACRRAETLSLDAATAAMELARQLEHPHLGYVLFFCSAEYDLPALEHELKHRFRQSIAVFGCTTAGEITPAGYQRRCISAVGLDHRYFRISHRLLQDLEHVDFVTAQEVVDQLIISNTRCGVGNVRSQSFALTLLDGLSSKEELVLSALSATLADIPHFGGSAGDDNHLSETYVFCDGAFHTDAAIVMLITTTLPFEVFTTHHLLPTDIKLVVTEADRDTRTVKALNGLPAADAYASALGIPTEQLNDVVFACSPLAVRFSDEFYVRSIQRVNADKSLTFYCAVDRGIVLTLMAADNIVENLARMLECRQKRLGNHSIVIAADCFLRREEVNARHLQEPMSQLLRQHRVMGFNSYGEHIDGMHINQTFTAVRLGTTDQASHELNHD